MERLEEFTQYLNRNVLQGRIIFRLKHDGRELTFPDTTVRLINGYLVTDMYSKATDAHQYLYACELGATARTGCKEANTLLTI